MTRRRRVRPERPARVEAVVPPVLRLLRAVDHAAFVRVDPGRRHRLGRRREPSRPRRQDPRCGELRRRLGTRRHARPRNVRRGSHRSRSEQRHRDRRPRAVRRAARRQGGHEVARDSGRGRGEGDPLGCRQRCAGHQHEPRRHPRPARSRSRHLLAARGRRRRVRDLERRGGRRRGRELRPGAVGSLEVRELPGSAPARSRCQRNYGLGRRADLLESRPHLQRHRGTRAAHPLRSSQAADCALPVVHRAGLLELRPRGLPRGTGHVLRRSAGERSRGGPAEPAADTAAGAGDCDPRADRARPRRDEWLLGVRTGRDAHSGWGRLDVGSRDRRARPSACPSGTGTRRTTTSARGPT